MPYVCMITLSVLWYTINKVGPRTEPCGAPYFITSGLERELFTLTDVGWPSRYGRINSNALSVIPVSASR